MIPSEVQAAVVEALHDVELPEELHDEQRDLSPLILSALRERLGADFDVFPAVSGQPRQARCVRLFGTTFWPDFAIHRGGENEGVVAVEIKLVKPGRQVASAISQAFGQALIYRLVYQKVLVLIVHRGRARPSNHEHDAAMIERLSQRDISVVFRSAP